MTDSFCTVMRTAEKDAMEDEELRLGPNGSLVFCWEFLLENMDWLQKEMQGQVEDAEIDDDYILFDCPGQIELYTHMKCVRQFVEILQHQWNFRICGVFLIDSQFMVDGSKFLSGSMAALSAMINLELPHVNILSKARKRQIFIITMIIILKHSTTFSPFAQILAQKG